MSSATEVCPFCGKSYKRLKSHLPHCKAAKPPLSHNEPVASPPPGRLEANSSKMKGKKKTPQHGEKASSAEVSGKSGKTSPPPKPKKKTTHASVETVKSSHISPGSDSASQRLKTVPPRATSTKSKSKHYLSAESPKPKSASKKKPNQINEDIKSPAEEIMAVGKEIPRITLQHIGSTLGRTKTSRPAIHIETTQNTKSTLDSSPASTSIILQPKQSLYGSNQSSRKTPLLPDLQTSKVVFQQTELTSVLPERLSNLQCRPQNTLATIERRKDNFSGRSLGQVTLRELPEWLVCRAPRRPGDAVEMMQRECC
ncbi:uncharacterized protein LOC144038142 isoform X2 [Vanacampus margaritifer]